MKKHINLCAYDDYEKINSKKEIEKYREKKIIEVKDKIIFIKEKLGNNLSVLEIGSGNSKILYALESENILKQGVGIEVSKSRFKFAEEWKRDENFNKTTNINEDVLNVDFNKIGKMDLCLALDLVLHFLAPIKENSDKEILKKIYENLNFDGILILEMEDLFLLSDKKWWEEFQESDPWMFSLWNCKHDKKNNFLTWEKYFIHRIEAKKSFSSIVLKMYKTKHLQKILKEIGFKDIRFMSDWGSKPEKKLKNIHGEYIIIAKK